jgi:secreted PhoX family phosphatase
MFVGIQHPGGGVRNKDGSYPSNFPESGQAKPRSSIVAIQRDDGRSFAD